VARAFAGPAKLGGGAPRAGFARGVLVLLYAEEIEFSTSAGGAPIETIGVQTSHTPSKLPSFLRASRVNPSRLRVNKQRHYKCKFTSIIFVWME
jgi:hypothetical protein